MFTVTANVCDGSDYVATWEGGTFDDVDKAIAFFNAWCPPRSEVANVVQELINNGIDPDNIDLQIAVWDEAGNDLRFYSELMFASV